MVETEVRITFKQYTFERDKTNCHKCEPARWLVIANYELVQMPICNTYETFIHTPLKVIVGSYKNKKDANKALYQHRIQKRGIKFNLDGTILKFNEITPTRR